MLQEKHKKKIQNEKKKKDGRKEVIEEKNKAKKSNEKLEIEQTIHVKKENHMACQIISAIDDFLPKIRSGTASKINRYTGQMHLL